MKTKRSPHKWFPEHDQYLRDNIEGTPRKKIVEMINNEFSLDLSFGQVKHRLRKLGLRNNIDMTFQKGIIPYTKGLTWDDFLSEEHQEQLRRTQFKKGEMPLNWCPVGTERVDKSYGYVYVKVQNEGTWPQRWRLKQYVEWEKVNGPVPEDKRFVFLDGNRENCNIDNLRLVDYGVGAIMNKQRLYVKGDSELMETSINTVELMVAINEVAGRLDD